MSVARNPHAVAPNHQGTHTAEYCEKLVERLNDVDPSQRRAELADIAKEIADGTFP